MSFDPLLAAPWHVQIHGFAAIAALLIGVVQLIAPKGTLPHKWLGGIWILLMTAVTISSAFIVYEREPGEPFIAHYSLIHIFTVITGVSLIYGVWLILFGGSRMKRHSGPFIGVFFGGLVIAGAFTLLPGRIMHAVVFGGEAATLESLDPPSWYFLDKPESD